MLCCGVGGKAVSAWQGDEQCLGAGMEVAFEEHSKSSQLVGTWLWAGRTSREDMGRSWELS